MGLRLTYIYMKKFLRCFVSLLLAANVCFSAVNAAPSADIFPESVDESYDFAQPIIEVQEQPVQQTELLPDFPLETVKEIYTDAVPSSVKAILDGEQGLLYGILPGEGTKESPFLISSAAQL